MKTKYLVNNLLAGTVSVGDLTKSELNKCYVLVNEMWNDEQLKQGEKKNFSIFNLLNALYCESMTRIGKQV